MRTLKVDWLLVFCGYVTTNLQRIMIFMLSYCIIIVYVKVVYALVSFFLAEFRPKRLKSFKNMISSSLDSDVFQTAADSDCSTTLDLKFDGPKATASPDYLIPNESPINFLTPRLFGSFHLLGKGCFHVF